MKGFSSVENEQSINVELRHDRPYTKAINNKQLSAVAIRLGFLVVLVKSLPFHQAMLP
ncbi:TipJ family phage tail tip protein [Moraxella catarrhalis]|uniref:TipJ family phage tail tip protein n=1 Tax=Moraxella catarrhalis TaxID=480 RepID=UPI003F766A3D